MNEVATYLSFGLQTEHRPALTECEKGFESPTSRCKMKHRIDWDYFATFLPSRVGGSGSTKTAGRPANSVGLRWTSAGTRN